ncbi:DAK2 domain-containing protein [Nocardia inohanensis]|uniref:DAK2 domain-containing protein n=1 Tax=Nocardia inohanensis TaxID=209246 RepID=UPI000A77FD45|nr:DAK2 domain-containing protein [Nocardia inohanensis]
MPGVGDALDGTALLRWGQLSLAGLERHRDEINALNVFPVPDSDTGTNLLATMRAAVRSAETDSNRMSAREVAGVMARAATLGARGNSGIILSQVLRGVADVVRDGPLTEATLRLALRRAARLVREALSSPVEGTMLTVLDRAAESAAACPERTLPAVALAAADGAAKALGETPAQLGVLREAGVVDAGARGLLVLLDELVVVAGGPAPRRPAYVRSGAESGRPVASGARSVVAESGRGAASPRRWQAVDDHGTGVPAGGRDADSVDGAHAHAASVSNTVDSERNSRLSRGGPPLAHEVPAAGGDSAVQYEVMYVLDGSDDARIIELRDRLAGLGDSVVVVGDGAGSWSAHVHCADAGAAVEAGLAAGRLSGIRIETLAASAHAPGGDGRGILAVASGAGAVRLFEDAGAAVLEGEVTAEALLEGIRRLPHREVLVLPNGALPAHELVAVSVAARDGQREVLMLPCGSMVQGLAALSMHDGGRIAVDDAFAMSEAAAGTRWGALRIAAERALTIVGTCEAGDGLGLVGHDVVVIDADVRQAGRTLLDRMLGLGGELVTMLLGADAPEGLSEELSAHVLAGFPGVEVVVYPGGQAGDLVQIGVE